MPDMTMVGGPGLRAANLSIPRRSLLTGVVKYLPGGVMVSSAVSRDPGNTGDVNVLRSGTLMGKITASGLWAPSILGVIANAEVGSSTQFEVSVAEATEIVRRIGATGSVKVTGPPAASGVVRSLTATLSAVNTGTGAVTFTSLQANQVQRVNFNIASTAGNLMIAFTDPTTGARVTTAAIAWNATDATYLASIISALDTATGVVGGIVATAIAATDTDLGFNLTFSGTGYAGVTHPLVSIPLLPTSSTNATVTQTVAAVAGGFAAGSFIQPADGSENPRSIIPDGSGLLVTDSGGTNVDAEWPDVPIMAVIDASQIINWPSDTSLREWIRATLNTYGTFVLDNAYTP